MRKLTLFAGALVLAVAVPAAAHPHPEAWDRDGGIEVRIDRIEDRLDRDAQRGRIAPADVSALEQELRSIRYLQSEYARSGLTDAESDELHRRIDALQQRMSTAMQRPGRYQDRDDIRRDRRGDDQRWDRRDDRGRDDRGRPDMRSGRAGDPERDYRRRDWEERERWVHGQCPEGLERRDNGCVPPGQAQRDSGPRQEDPYRVPDHLRERFRDTDRYYYRYRDGYIYQMDRTSGQALNTIYVGR